MSWEDICNQCGKCCFHLSEEGRSTTEHCKYLGEDNQCTVYSERFEICSTCAQLTKANVGAYKLTGFLPKDCAYLKEKL